ncbi:MAG: V-type ATP synthase subunit K [Brevinema sp.]
MKKVFAFSVFAAVAASLNAQEAVQQIVVQAAAPTAPSFATAINWGLVFGILGAAIATFGGGFGSSIGVGIAGEVGNAVLTEDSKKFGSVLVLQALPMTQGIYGLLFAFMFLGKVNVLTADASGLTNGLGILFAALPVGISGFISGVWQGKVSAAGMQLIARRPKQMGQAIILPAMVETFAVFGLLASILLLNLIS